MADQPDTARCTPGTMSLRLKVDAMGWVQWHLSVALADQPPTEAPRRASGTIYDESTSDGLHFALNKALSQLLGSIGDPER